LPEPYSKKKKNTGLLDPAMIFAAWLSQDFLSLPWID
jgi:hypothetical protein